MFEFSRKLNLMKNGAIFVDGFHTKFNFPRLKFRKLSRLIEILRQSKKKTHPKAFFMLLAPSVMQKSVLSEMSSSTRTLRTSVAIESPVWEPFIRRRAKTSLHLFKVNESIQ